MAYKVEASKISLRYLLLIFELVKLTYKLFK